MTTIHMVQEPYPSGGVGNSVFCLVVESCSPLHVESRTQLGLWAKSRENV